jgi:hypothetical protein
MIHRPYENQFGDQWHGSGDMKAAIPTALDDSSHKKSTS